MSDADCPSDVSAHARFVTAEAIASLATAALAVAALATVAASVATSLDAGYGWGVSLQQAVLSSTGLQRSGGRAASAAVGSWGWSAGSVLGALAAAAALLQRWLSGWVAQFVFVDYDKNHPGKRP